MGLLGWLVVGTLSGATAIGLLLDWLEALGDGELSRSDGFGLQLAIAVAAAWIFVFASVRVVRLLRRVRIPG